MTYIKILTSVLIGFGASTATTEDALPNHFTAAELESALGTRAAEIMASGILDPQDAPAYKADENDDDADVTERSAANPTEGLIHQARGGAGAPIWGPFTAAFRQCAPGCVPANYNVYRRGRRTCHSQGRAIDVGSIICDGQEYPAIRGGKFNTFVACMQSHLIVLYHERRGRGPTRDHYDHAHFSVGCTL